MTKVQISETKSDSILVGEKVNHPSDVSINKIFEDSIEDDVELKDKIALINSETEKSVTYNELNEKANKIARVFLKKIKDDGIRPNSDGDYIVALR